ncbi:hypothetical protein KC360_g8293 [Hortaea werneckii]|nr:hypothetical protein KC325_g8287 [Hortaea werneckii]KAI6986788.1 hypothetical protein KC359_g8581 [Hortaea werneckii]KAI7141037.1 hypothetical protein KC344_g8271 [Hortaea werneckii]KAI7168033.1 hypothetical protein KC360_g8293 [Hortaea werneckii]
MAASPPNCEADTPSTVEKPFRFFDLPRELRNAIYPLFGDSRGAFCRRSLRYFEFHLTGPYLPKLRRLSKQFKREYDEEISAYLTLHMETGSRNPDFNHFAAVQNTLPREIFLSLRHLTFHMKRSSIPTWQRLGPVVDRNLAAHLKTLQALQSPTFIVRASLSSLEKVIEDTDYDPVIFLTNPTLVPSHSNPDQREVKVSKSLRLTNICYYPTWWELPATAKYQYAFSEDGARDADINFWPQNRIVYKATASEHENSWHGLDLATFSCG